MDIRAYKEAAGLYEAIVADLKPTGQELQDLWLEAGKPYFYLQDMDGVRKCLENAFEAAPQGRQVERINSMMKRFFPKPEETGEGKETEGLPAAATEKQ